MPDCFSFKFAGRTESINRDLKHDDAFNTMWPPILSIDKCCQVTSLSIERADHHVLLKASSCLRCLIATQNVKASHVITLVTLYTYLDPGVEGNFHHIHVSSLMLVLPRIIDL